MSADDMPLKRYRNAVGMPVTLSDGLYQVMTDRFVAGFTVANGRVVQCAPILRNKLDQWVMRARRLR